MTLDVNQVERIDQLAQNVHQQIFGNAFYYTELEQALKSTALLYAGLIAARLMATYAMIIMLNTL